MPCNDDGWPGTTHTIEVDRPVTLKKIKNLEAVLCGIFTYYEGKYRSQFKGTGLPNLLSNLDYKEMGVSRKWIEDWWRQHQLEDKVRLAAEAAISRTRAI